MMTKEEQSQPENREKEGLRFLDTLRYELKTPLTSIIAAAGLLAEELEENGDESLTRLIKSIMRNADTLETRLNDLFEIIRTGNDGLQLQIEPIDIKSLLQGVGWEVSPLTESKSIRFTLETPASLPMVHGDGKKLKQVVLNLVTNAAKFTPEGGHYHPEDETRQRPNFGSS